MKKLIAFICVIGGFARAQNGSHIHNLFGVSDEGSGIYVLEALNQNNGTGVPVETLPFSFTFGSNFLYSTTSNFVAFTDTQSINFAAIFRNYSMPSVYTLTYSGYADSTIFGQYSGIFTNQTEDSFYYVYNHAASLISKISVVSQVAVLNNNFNVGNFQPDASMVAYDSFLIINNGNVCTIFNKNSLTFFDQISSPLYQSVYLCADSVLGVFGVAKTQNDAYVLVTIDFQGLNFVEIATLPSCNNCTNETFTYDKNAMVLSIENNSIIVSRTETISGQNNYYLSSFNLSNAQTIYNHNIPNKISHLMLQKPLPDLVYPGDANHNKIVNMEDIFPIGIHYNDFVDFRDVISTSWIGQNAFDATDTLANGVNIKHADCNGDGTIDNIDIDDAVLGNYFYTHNSEKSTQSTCNFPLFFRFTTNYKEGDSVAIQIGLDMNNNLSQNVYGIKFTIEFDSTYVVNNTMRTAAINDWFGIENNNFLLKQKNDYAANKIDVGIVGIDKLNRTGGGVLVNALWTMEDEVIPITAPSGTMLLKITDVKIIDFAENEVDACGVDTFMVVYDKTVGITNRTENKVLDIHPNPSKGGSIYLNNLNQAEMLQVFSVEGKLLATYTNVSNAIDVSTLNNGVYIVKAKDKNENTYVNKLMVAK